MPSVNLVNIENEMISESIVNYKNCSDSGDSHTANTGFAPLSSSLEGLGNMSTNIHNSCLNSNQIKYSAFISPCQSNKFNYQSSNCLNSGEFRSLQNSPFYSSHPMSGNNNIPVSRALSPGSSMLLNGRNSQYSNSNALDKNAGHGPQRELFPHQNGAGNGLLYQDKLHFYAIAQKQGFIVGGDLERIKENSRRSISQAYGRISTYFRNRYGETEAKSKASYLQLGVRVPSKDHVSEIVGKGGQKIKLIREETGALITTPGEHEEHVFIIEAPPEIALSVAGHLSKRAEEITQSKLISGDRRRGSTGSNPGTPNSSSVCNCNCYANGLTTCCCSSSNTINSDNNSSNGTVSCFPTKFSGQSQLTNESTKTFLGSSNGDTLSSQLINSQKLFNCVSSMQMNGNSTTVNMSSVGSNGCNSNRVLLARSKISVPQDMVGKIIGTQGSIITTIQKDTGTEIKSPPKESGRGPEYLADFEISAYQGLALNSTQAAECRVQQAKQLIGHLVMRQLERRSSEDVDDPILTPSSDRGTHNNNGNGTMNGSQNPAWMWPEVTQMESNEAREVLDRILAESKSKTRRAKDLPGANPPTPVGSGSFGGNHNFMEGSNGDGSNGGGSMHQPMLRTLSHNLPNCYERSSLCNSNFGGSHACLNGTDVWIQHANNTNNTNVTNSGGNQRNAVTSANQGMPSFSNAKSSLPTSPLRNDLFHENSSLINDWFAGFKQSSQANGNSSNQMDGIDLSMAMDNLCLNGCKSGNVEDPPGFESVFQFPNSTGNFGSNSNDLNMGNMNNMLNDFGAGNGNSGGFDNQWPIKQNNESSNNLSNDFNSQLYDSLKSMNNNGHSSSSVGNNSTQHLGESNVGAPGVKNGTANNKHMMMTSSTMSSVINKLFQPNVGGTLLEENSGQNGAANLISQERCTNSQLADIWACKQADGGLFSGNKFGFGENGNNACGAIGEGRRRLTPPSNTASSGSNHSNNWELGDVVGDKVDRCSSGKVDSDGV